MTQEHTDHDAMVRRWTEIADDDLEIAGMILDSGSRALAQAGFHAQQAVEKMLKALLVIHGADPAETHDLNRLLFRLRSLEPDLMSKLGPIRDLTPYAVFHRYPPRVPAYERELDRATVLCDVMTARAACQTLDQIVEAHLARRARARARFPKPVSCRR